eukprot:254727-Chlamydomonas_euryale.AAC.14
MPDVSGKPPVPERRNERRDPPTPQSTSHSQCTTDTHRQQARHAMPRIRLRWLPIARTRREAEGWRRRHGCAMLWAGPSPCC